MASAAVRTTRLPLGRTLPYLIRSAGLKDRKGSPLGSIRFFASGPDDQRISQSNNNNGRIRTLSTAVEERVSSDDNSEAKRESSVNRRDMSEVLISEVLEAKHAHRWVEPQVNRLATVREAISICIDGGLSGMMVVEHEHSDKSESGETTKVVGMTTSRDLLRIMERGIKEGKSSDEIMSLKVGDFMTPISQVIFAKPEETIRECLQIMAKLSIKCLPILKNGNVIEGLITNRDISDFTLDARDRGGKKAFLKNISQRVGLSSHTSMAEPPQYLRAHLALEQNPLFVNLGVAELPHPFKTQDGVAMRMRDFEPQDFSSDPQFSEDAYFVTSVKLTDQDKNVQEFTYMGVADGVGSWREYGVDPREFSHKLMEECENLLREASAKGKKHDASKFGRMISPSEVLAQAHDRVKMENVVGSSTACVALFDGIRHQLHFSNLGDSGLIVLRHIDSDVAGTLKRNRETPRSERKSDLRVAFVSQQQLRSFNHPYQLGWTGEELDEEEGHSFKTAANSCTSSIHLRRGDIVIMATDGLFDNVDVDEITQAALEWEQKYGFIRGGDIAAREKRWAMGSSMTVLSSEAIPSLAEELCQLARERSLDHTIDSPFALLAKENDIMWSGGMPDDCTVLCMHVVGRSADDKVGRDHF